MADKLEPVPLLTPAEVAEIFRVDPKTVARWAKAGKLSAIRTLGNHRRFYEAEVRALLAMPKLTETAAVTLTPIPDQPMSAGLAERRDGLSGDTVTVEGDSIVFRRDGRLVRALDDLPDGTDLDWRAGMEADAAGAAFVAQVAS